MTHIFGPTCMTSDDQCDVMCNIGAQIEAVQPCTVQDAMGHERQGDAMVAMLASLPHAKWLTSTQGAESVTDTAAFEAVLHNTTRLAAVLITFTPAADFPPTISEKLCLQAHVAAFCWSGRQMRSQAARAAQHRWTRCWRSCGRLWTSGPPATRGAQPPAARRSGAPCAV